MRDERPRTERFEQLIAWQKARVLTVNVYGVTRQFERQDRAFADQIRRAAVSIPSTIAEGFERGRLREFRQFLSVAKGSCAELRTQLYIAADVAYLQPDAADKLLSDADEVSRIIAGLRRSIAPGALHRTFRRTTTRA